MHHNEPGPVSTRASKNISARGAERGRHALQFLDMLPQRGLQRHYNKQFKLDARSPSAEHSDHAEWQLLNEHAEGLLTVNIQV